MVKSILASITILLVHELASAETLSCNAFLMKASAKMADEQSSMYAEKLEIKGKAGDFLDGSMTYQNMKFITSAVKDDRSDLYEVTYAMTNLATGKRELMDQFLLLGTGPSKQNGWEGPKGTLNYEFIRSSFQPIAMVGFFTESAFAKLSPLGVQRRALLNLSSSDNSIIENAVHSGIFKEGEVIGAGFLLNCFAK